MVDIKFKEWKWKQLFSTKYPGFEENGLNTVGSDGWTRIPQLTHNVRFSSSRHYNHFLFSFCYQHTCLWSAYLRTGLRRSAMSNCISLPGEEDATTNDLNRCCLLSTITGNDISKSLHLHPFPRHLHYNHHHRHHDHRHHPHSLSIFIIISTTNTFSIVMIVVLLNITNLPLCS